MRTMSFGLTTGCVAVERKHVLNGQGSKASGPTMTVQELDFKAIRW